MNEVKLVSNAGVFIALDGVRLLVDAFVGESHPPYRTMPRGIFDYIMAAPDVTALLYTHYHPDHCCAHETVRYLSVHPSTLVIAGDEVRQKLLDAGAPEGSLCAVGEGGGAFTLGGVRIEAFPTRHLGLEYKHKQHYSFLISGSRRIVIAGDATPVFSNFMPGGEPIGALDLLIATYPFVTGNPAMRLFQTAMRPERVFVTHLPPRAQGGDLYDMLDAAVAEGRPFAAIVPEKPADGLEL